MGIGKIRVMRDMVIGVLGHRDIGGVWSWGIERILFQNYFSIMLSSNLIYLIAPISHNPLYPIFKK